MEINKEVIDGNKFNGDSSNFKNNINLISDNKSISQQNNIYYNKRKSDEMGDENDGIKEINHHMDHQDIYTKKIKSNQNPYEIIDRWISDNRKLPYPTHEQKFEIFKQTHLSMEEISRRLEEVRENILIKLRDRFPNQLDKETSLLKVMKESNESFLNKIIECDDIYGPKSTNKNDNYIISSSNPNINSSDTQYERTNHQIQYNNIIKKEIMPPKLNPPPINNNININFAPLNSIHQNISTPPINRLSDPLKKILSLRKNVPSKIDNNNGPSMMGSINQNHNGMIHMNNNSINANISPRIQIRNIDNHSGNVIHNPNIQNNNMRNNINITPINHPYTINNNRNIQRIVRKNINDNNTNTPVKNNNYSINNNITINNTIKQSPHSPINNNKNINSLLFNNNNHIGIGGGGELPKLNEIIHNIPNGFRPSVNKATTLKSSDISAINNINMNNLNQFNSPSLKSKINNIETINNINENSNSSDSISIEENNTNVNINNNNNNINENNTNINHINNPNIKSIFSGGEVPYGNVRNLIPIDQINFANYKLKGLNTNPGFESKIIAIVPFGEEVKMVKDDNGNSIIFSVTVMRKSKTDLNQSYEKGISMMLEDKDSDRNIKNKYPKNILNVLEKWLLENKTNPFPSKTEKEMLGEITGLSQTQINNWFTNTRRRAKNVAEGKYKKKKKKGGEGDDE